MNKKITKRQADVLVFIKKFIAEHGFPPSTREIGSALGLSSPATVHTHLAKLCEAGYIKKTNSKFRTIEIVGPNEYAPTDETVVTVPLLGKIACGNPVLEFENPSEFFTLPASLVPHKKEVFTLKASGESMIKAGIYDGDIVIIQKQNTAHNGDIVVAMTDDNEITLKTFYKENNNIRLQPENDTMSPIYLSNCTILGKAVGLYRNL